MKFGNCAGIITQGYCAGLPLSLCGFGKEEKFSNQFLNVFFFGTKRNRGDGFYGASSCLSLFKRIDGCSCFHYMLPELSSKSSSSLLYFFFFHEGLGKT